MKTYIFFEEGSDEILFEVEAENDESAFDIAFNFFGPQANDWMYKEKLIV